MPLATEQRDRAAALQLTQATNQQEIVDAYESRLKTVGGRPHC